MMKWMFEGAVSFDRSKIENWDLSSIEQGPPSDPDMYKP